MKRSTIPRAVPLCGAVLLGSVVSASAEIRILVDHIGYEASEAHKLFLVEGTPKDKPSHFILRNATTGTVALQGDLQYAGPVAHWRFTEQEGGGPRIFWTGDLSTIHSEGDYTLEVTSHGASQTQTCTFQIAHNLLEQKALSNVLFYFKSQRVCGSFERADEHLRLPAQLAAPSST